MTLKISSDEARQGLDNCCHDEIKGKNENFAGMNEETYMSSDETLPIEYISTFQVIFVSPTRSFRVMRSRQGLR